MLDERSDRPARPALLQVLAKADYERSAVRLELAAGAAGSPSATRGVCGVLVSVGGQLDDLCVGDRLFGAADAEAVTSADPMMWGDVAMLARAPAALSDIDAASLAVPACAAMQLLIDEGNLQQDQTIVVLGGSPIFRSLVVQLARLVGATVHADAAPEEFESVRRTGALPVVTPVPGQFGCADLVIQAGGGAFSRSREWLRSGGSLLSLSPGRSATLYREGKSRPIELDVTSARLRRITYTLDSHQISSGERLAVC